MSHSNEAPADLVSMVHRIDEQLAAAGQLPLLPQSVKAAPSHRFIHFAVAADDFAVPISSVIETGYLPEVTPLPNVTAALRGVINFRGEVLPLFDLRRLLGYQESFGARGERMIVVRTASSQGLCAFAVDRVNVLLALAPEEMQSSDASFTCGFWLRPSGRLRLLDLERLFQHLSDSQSPEATHVRLTQ